ncbi:MAG: hypothetical protein AAF488_12850 [Planctomycetota bacterium]
MLFSNQRLMDRVVATRATVLTVAMLFGTLVGVASGVEILVPADQPTVQAAIDVAVDGDEVVVAPGVYVENIAFNGKAITVRSSAGKESTILDGSALTAGPDFGCTVRFVDGEGPDSVLDGFTVIGGTGAFLAGSSPSIFQIIGGGVFASYASPTLRSCRFTLNSAASRGGGVGFVEIEGEALVEDCEFIENTSPNGAGLRASGPGSLTIRNSLFLANESVLGGGGAGARVGTATILVEDCIFEANDSATTTAGLGLGNYSSVGWTGNAVATVRRCEFIGNEAAVYGAIVAYRCAAAIEDCLIEGNSSDQSALTSDFANVVAVRCRMVGNTAPNTTVASTLNPGSITLDRCTLADNVSPAGVCSFPGASAGILMNTILRGPDPASTVASVPNLTITYSNIEGGFAGVGNIDVDPLFVAPIFGDYRLMLGSPCIDAGDPTTELDPDGTNADMGALFFDQMIADFVRGDANQDGVVEISDPVWMLEELFLGGPASPCGSASDANDDGIHDVSDVLAVLNAVFIGPDPLPEPSAACGSDPTPDSLECAAPICP